MLQAVCTCFLRLIVHRKACGVAFAAYIFQKVRDAVNTVKIFEAHRDAVGRNLICPLHKLLYGFGTEKAHRVVAPYGDVVYLHTAGLYTAYNIVLFKSQHKFQNSGIQNAYGVGGIEHLLYMAEIVVGLYIVDSVIFQLRVGGVRRLFYKGDNLLHMHLLYVGQIFVGVGGSKTLLVL